MIEALKKHTGIKLICIFVFLLCGLVLVEVTTVSIFATTVNIEIPVTSMHILKPIVLSALGIASAIALLYRKAIGKYGLMAWFLIYIEILVYF